MREPLSLGRDRGFFVGGRALLEDDMSDKWNKRTSAVHGGTKRSQWGEVSEAIFLTQGFVYDSAEAAAARFRVPQPRVKLGRALMESGLVTASADISDGLVADLAHIAEESRLRGLIDGPFVPLSPAGQAAVAADAAWFPKLITGGDDYELVITGPASADAALRRIARDTGIPLTPIGWMEEGSGVTVYGEDGEPISLERAGYTHFQP